MTRHLFPRAHLPHPHIAQHLADAFAAAFHHREAPLVADGHDWDDWHFAPAEADWEHEHDGRTEP
ncbi:hypothetical protein [Nocardia vulneris]|uniref:Uncharacterized protein n=1 Tax=Nocardia vulneris TaxID=1141657 RepID=A0ABR4ZCG2_9NOCA|nr:hypothetical protein [Nocardia vulneris]KIA63042.1 hypothetical protein FG87_22045 [Nocardia vulneris]